MKFKIDRPPSLALMAQLAAFTLGAGVIAAAGYGFGVSSVPEAKQVVRTIVRDTPPSCTEAIEAARSERAHTATAVEHTALAGARSADRFDAELSRDDDTIADAADALETELLLVQQADLDAAAAAVAFDTAADECAGGAR